MPVVKTSDKSLPKRERLCSILGKMLNERNSVQTKKKLAEDFRDITVGIPLKDILTKFKLTGDIVKEENRLLLDIKVPNEYVDPTLKLEEEEKKVSFVITQYIDVTNASSTEVDRDVTNNSDK